MRLFVCGRVTELESWFPFVILIMFLFACYVSGHAWPLHALLHSMFCIISTLFCWVNSFHQISNLFELLKFILYQFSFLWYHADMPLFNFDWWPVLFLLFILSSTHTLLWGLMTLHCCCSKLMTCHFMIFKWWFELMIRFFVSLYLMWSCFIWVGW